MKPRRPTAGIMDGGDVVSTAVAAWGTLVVFGDSEGEHLCAQFKGLLIKIGTLEGFLLEALLAVEVRRPMVSDLACIRHTYLPWWLQASCFGGTQAAGARLPLPQGRVPCGGCTLRHQHLPHCPSTQVHNRDATRTEAIMLPVCMSHAS